MKKNIGTTDRIVRLLIAIVCFVAVFMGGNSYIKIILSVLSIFTLYESLFGWCAFYALIGKNTCPIQ
jgi:hypothetical protein